MRCALGEWKEGRMGAQMAEDGLGGNGMMPAGKAVQMSVREGEGGDGWFRSWLPFIAS